MGSFIQLLLVASMPFVKFLLLTALGVVLATKRINLLGDTARRQLNQMVFYVFGPAFIGSHLAQTITLESFLTMWFIPINILLTFVVGSGLGWVVAKITRAPKHLMPLVVSCCSAGNLVALPIIIITSICTQPGSPFGAADVCNQYGLAYASLSMAAGAIYVWLYIYNIVRISSKKEVETITANGGSIDKQPGGATVINIHDSERLSSSEFTETATVVVVERPPSIHQSTAGSIDNFSSSNKFMVATVIKIRQGLRNTCKNINLKAVLAPSTIAVAGGFFIGMIPPLRNLFFGKRAPLRVVGDSSFMIAYAAIIVGIIIVRFIILPLLGILVLKGAVRAGFVQSHNLLLQFVILLQYSLPPALSIGTITQRFGEGESECSVIMLWTYVVSPATVTLWCTLFLWLLSH